MYTNENQLDLNEDSNIDFLKSDAKAALNIVNFWVENIDSKASYILAVAGVLNGYVLVQDISGLVNQINVISCLITFLYLSCFLAFVLPILALM